MDHYVSLCPCVQFIAVSNFCVRVCTWSLCHILCACVQLISAGLTWFLDGVYLTMPTTTAQSLNVTVRLRDTTSTLLTTGDYTLVQVSECPEVSKMLSGHHSFSRSLIHSIHRVSSPRVRHIQLRLLNGV